MAMARRDAGEVAGREGVTAMSSQGQGRRIVVGVDGSASSMAALRWAIRQAKLTGSSVDAVIAWHLPAGYGMAPMGDRAVDFEGDAKQTLVGALNEVGGTEPEVLVRPSVVQGRTADVLVRAARGADLLVMGSRGHGEFTSALLGSVSHFCVHHASCPVLMIRGSGDGSR
jgi:nucleotide-binding universal stress UspA family protein